MKIYLAGGMRTRPMSHFFAKGINSIPSPFVGQDEMAWADLMNHLLMMNDNEVFDPLTSDTKDFDTYSFIDVMKLRWCDVVVAYLEEENPSGMGLAAEIAYAKGLGKTVLLINEKHDDRYVRFIENFADLVYTNLSEALPAIRRIR